MILPTILLSALIAVTSASPQQFGGRPRPFNQPSRQQYSNSPAPAAYSQTAAPAAYEQAAPVSYNEQPAAALSSSRIAGSNPNAAARILRQEQDNQYDGTFNYVFETDNGISQSAQGQLKNAGTDQETQVVQGSYSYTSPEGQVITITYIADEEGFRPVGDAIPTPPPVPEAIARALEYIRSLPPAKEDQYNQPQQYKQ